MAARKEIFISYSQDDDALRAELEMHLAALRREGILEAWHDRRIIAGEDFKNIIDQHLNAAHVILLLVSASYVASEYCWDVEMRRALERQGRDEAHVIPILLRDCDWKNAPFARLAALPQNGRPVTSWQNRDEAWADVTRGIRVAVAGQTIQTPALTKAPTAMAKSYGRHEPHFETHEIRGLAEQLETAYARRTALQEVNADTGAVDREILALRHRLREGGQLRAGDSLGDGRYLLLRQLGRGGFAFVWDAVDRRTGERMAIKVLHTSLAADRTRVERFVRGARIMAELNHEAIVRILRPYGEDGGYHYFAMELVELGDLRRAVLEKRFTLESLMTVIARVGDALEHAHAKGLVHRDVKPANILLDGAGAPKLTDFDLVGATDTTGGTRTGAMGTFLYSAPEVLDRPQEADARADVYSLAMTAIFVLHGAELPLTVVRDARDFIGRLDCSEATKEALARAVSWDREKRFSSPSAFCSALTQSLKEAHTLQEAPIKIYTQLPTEFSNIDRTKHLTSRQREIVALLGRTELSHKEIADQLGMTERLLQAYAGNIYKILGVQSRADLVAALSRAAEDDLMAANFEGVWIDTGTQSARTYFVRIINEEVRIAYSLAAELPTGEIYNTVRVGRKVFGRFRWFDRAFFGYAYLILQHPDAIGGGWWMEHDVPPRYGADLTRLTESVPDMVPYKLVRKGSIADIPPWVRDYFERV